MGNRKNRAARRKKRNTNYLRNLRGPKRSMLNPTNDTTENTMNDTMVDVVSMLCPSDIKLEVNDTFDPIATTTENDMESSGSDVKSQITYVDNTKVKCEIESDIESISEMTIEPEPRSKAIDIIKNDKQIDFKNICRLCLTGQGSAWIDLFSSEPYENCNEITPSNILEVIEQFTTVKITKDDRMPDKLCSKCFEALKYMYSFREKSVRSNKSLDSIVETLRMQPDRKKVLVKVIHLRPIQRPKFNKAINRVENRENVSGEVQCEICGKVFERYKLLQYHLNIHNGVRPFVCTDPFCEKSFYSPQNLRVHIKNVHCIAPEFKCDVCDKRYTTASKLKIHRTIHFPPSIPCKICGKLLRNESSISKHKASHTERLFKCNDCGKAFQKLYTLTVHQRIHTNEKPFVCCKCAEAFAYNCLLKAHTEKYHPT